MSERPVLDETDEEILRHFQRDGRLSNRAVAQILGLSEGAVRKRLKRLTQSGIVSYGLVVDIQSTGMEVSGYLGVQVKPKALAEVGDYVASLEECSLCIFATGTMNIRAYLYGRDRVILSQTLAEIGALDGVLRVEFREAIYFTQHRYEWIMAPDQKGLSTWRL